MSCGNCHRDSQREIFQRRVHIYFWYYKKRFFGDWRKEQKVRKSSDKTDQNVHNLKTGGKIPAWNSWSCFLFLWLHIWKEYTGFNSQRYWRKSCSVLHTSWKSHPWWERAGYPIRSFTLLPEAVIWHDSGYDSGFADNTAHVPTLLATPAVDPWQSVQSHCSWNQGWKIMRQKKRTWLFFTLIQIGYYSGSWNNWVRRQ